MADIVFEFPVSVPIERVFESVSSPAMLDQWWTKSAAGSPRLGEEYELAFGPGYDWRARVTQCEPPTSFELEMTKADADWMGTRLTIQLSKVAGGTNVAFSHSGWPNANQHYRASCYCWAMYLRVMKRFLESGEVVPYDERLDV